MYPKIEAFLQQSMHERADYAGSIAHITALFDSK
jgi:flagellum-specific ATP synthase